MPLEFKFCIAGTVLLCRVPLTLLPLLLLTAGCTQASIEEEVEQTGNGLENALIDTAVEFDRILPSELEVSDELKAALREEEGGSRVVYRDLTGIPTVGFGHVVLPEDGLKVGDTITPKQMEVFLEKDLELAEEGVRGVVVDLPLSQNEFDALVDLVYNVGPGNVSESESPKLHAAIKRRDYTAIADNLFYTKDAAGRVAAGLRFRSERRRRIFRERVYDNVRSG